MKNSYLKDVCDAMHPLPHEVFMLLGCHGVIVCLGVKILVL